MWTIDELVRRVGVALAAEYPGAPNGRVRDLPDRRAVRWYATTGLVDRPAMMRGRTALYGPRHLLQLVAVKRLQAQGRTLAEIQAALTGATEQSLAGIARVPGHLLTADEPAASADPPRARFWAAPAPQPPAAPAASLPGMTAATRPPSAATSPPAQPPQRAATPSAGAAHPPVSYPGGPTSTQAIAPADLPSGIAPADLPSGVGTAGPTALTGVALGGGVVLLVPARPAAEDYPAIAAAAGPLLDLLAARHLLTAADHPPTADHPRTADHHPGAAGAAPPAVVPGDSTPRHPGAAAQRQTADRPRHPADPADPADPAGPHQADGDPDQRRAVRTDRSPA